MGGVGDGAAATPLEAFLALGIDKRTAENAAVNQKVTANLLAVIAEAGVTTCDKTVGNLLYTVATKCPANALVHRPILIQYITSSQIKTPAQLDAALVLLGSIGPEALNVEKFEEACGVGVVVSMEEIQSAVDVVLKENMDSIVEQRYHINVGSLCGLVRKKLPWADAKAIKEKIDGGLEKILGAKTEADETKPVKKKKEKPAKAVEQTTAIITAPPSEEELNPYSIFPEPKENLKVTSLYLFIQRYSSAMEVFGELTTLGRFSKSILRKLKEK